MKPKMKYVDVCICNEEDAEKVLGIETPDSNVEFGELSTVGYVRVAEMIYTYYGCKYVAIILRKFYSVSRNGWSVMLYDAKALGLF